MSSNESTCNNALSGYTPTTKYRKLHATSSTACKNLDCSGDFYAVEAYTDSGIKVIYRNFKPLLVLNLYAVEVCTDSAIKAICRNSLHGFWYRI